MQLNKVPVFIGVASVAAALVASSSAVAVPMFRGIGDLPGGAFISTGAAVSSDGRTVAGQGVGVNGQEALRWQAPQLPTGLGDLPGGIFGSLALGISGDGNIVVGAGRRLSGSADVREAVRWTAGTGLVSLGTLGPTPPQSFADSQAFGISRDGQVIVGLSSSPTGAQAFRWTQAGGMVGIGNLPGATVGSTGYATSADGSVIVGRAGSASGPQPFRWTAGGGMVPLGSLGGAGDAFTTAYAVSGNGNIVVGTSVGAAGREAFLWQGGSMIGLGELPGGIVLSQARGVSDDGSVVVGSSYTDLGQTAFLWDAQQGMRPLEDALTNEYGLNLSSWRLITAQAITPDGKTIVGLGRNPGGFSEGFIVTLPEPGTFTLVLVGLATLGARRRRAGVAAGGAR